jgi:hypothetical protein
MPPDWKTLHVPVCNMDIDGSYSVRDAPAMDSNGAAAFTFHVARRAAARLVGFLARVNPGRHFMRFSDMASRVWGFSSRRRAALGCSNTSDTDVRPSPKACRLLMFG